MAGVTTEEPGDGRAYEGVLGGQQQQQFQYGEALAECRSLEQVENGSPSTSPRYWDSDDDDSDKGPKPADLYGKYTWKIDKFSQINKREVRSNAFEIGGYKWYILIYPQGCDVWNHLSLFLCVAHHDKLLPGWGHFAQFTIAVVNKDHKKSKYSDTLHRFCNKEHDWGWKKFMELSKALDGFIDADTLIIKAQVQVIRVRTDRPFRCLDSQYRRELLRVYLTNVEQICRRFAEERRGKLKTLIEDKARWSSIRAFWLGMDHSSRCHMSHEKTETILKVVVKHFFIEKEVTSTLVMDSLYSGLKVLEGQNKGKKKLGKCLEEEEFPFPIVQVEKDTFALVDDVLLLLERAAIEPLPPKDDKGRQNRTKDGSGEEFNKDSIEHDERRLTELGCRTIEIFVLSLIFSKIELKYREDIAFKMQEELIREEEASLLAELEQKAGQIDNKKKSKKKQGKQKRNNRKGKDKGRDDKTIFTLQDKAEEENHSERTELAAEPEHVLENSEAVEYVSDESDSVDCAPEILPSDSEDRNLSPVNWDTDNSDVYPRLEASSSRITGFSGEQNGIERSQSMIDDSSSTCSSDSVPSAVVSVSDKGKLCCHKNKKSTSRVTSHQTKLISESVDLVNEEPIQPVVDARRSNDASQSSNTVGSHSQASILSLQDKVANEAEQQVGKKELEIGSDHRNLSDEVAFDATIPLTTELKLKPQIIVSRPYSDIPTRTVDNSSVPLSSSAVSAAKSKSVDPHKFTDSKPTEKPVNIGIKKLDKSSVPYVPVMSRPLSAPLVPGPRPAASMISMVQMVPLLGRSVSAAGRLGLEPITAYANQSYVPQSYQNAIISGPGPITGSASAYSQNHSSSSMVNASLHSYSQAAPPSLASTQLSTPFGSERANHDPIKPNLSFGMLSHCESMENGPIWNNNVQRSYNLDNPVYREPQDHLPSELWVGPSSRPSHVLPPDEFPHLDIINDLLDDEHGIGMVTMMNSGSHSFTNGPHNLNRHYSLHGDPVTSGRLGPSCRFDMPRSYTVEGFQDGYGGGLGRNYDMVREITPPPQVGPRPYLNGQIDGFVPNQWQMSGSDVLYLSSRDFDSDGGYSSYRIPDYTDISTAGINGYTMYRPSN